MLKVIVVGAGAIGGYVGAKLAQAGHALTLLGRPALAEAVAAHGLRLIEPGDQVGAAHCRVVTSPAEAFAPDERFDLALFTVKTHDTLSTVDLLRPYAQHVDRFLSLQNGVSSEDVLAEAFGREKVVAGTILNPVSIREPGVVVLEKRTGGIGLSMLTPSAAGVTTLAEQFRQAGFTIRTYADYRSMKWSKLLLNLIGNVTSAILDLNTLQIFVDKRLFTVEVAALREAIRVAHALRIRFVALPGYPVPLLAAALRFLPLPFLQPVLVPLVAKGRGSKLPSLHIDLSGGKRCSEVDELNGAVVRAGAKANAPTPVNALLVETFNALQSGQVARSVWRRQVERLWIAYCRAAI